MAANLEMNYTSSMAFYPRHAARIPRSPAHPAGFAPLAGSSAQAAERRAVRQRGAASSLALSSARLFLVLVTAAILASEPAVFGCGCPSLGDVPIKPLFKRPAVVGLVSKLEVLFSPDGKPTGYLKATVLVEGAWNFRPARTLEVITGTTTCKFGFSVGQRELLFLDWPNPKELPSTDLCAGNRTLNDSETVTILAEKCGAPANLPPAVNPPTSRGASEPVVPADPRP